MAYEPQAGDTTMDEAVALLREALEHLEPERANSIIDSFAERAEAFCDKNAS